MLREIEKRFGARRAVPLYCSVDPLKHRPRPMMKRYACDLSYMGTYAPDRQPKLEEFLLEPARLCRRKQFLVAGPQYPKGMRWPENVRRITHLNPRWHPHFYSSSRITLNVTRREMVMAGYSPSVRLFEAAACGAAIISDNWAGLDTFFTPGEQVLLPAQSSDVIEYIRELGDEELRRIGLDAQQRILAEHTNQHRAIEFEDAVSRALEPSVDAHMRRQVVA
jgi:spore maturation protein CgeB